MLEFDRGPVIGAIVTKEQACPIAVERCQGAHEKQEQVQCQDPEAIATGVRYGVTPRVIVGQRKGRLIKNRLALRLDG